MDGWEAENRRQLALHEAAFRRRGGNAARACTRELKRKDRVILFRAFRSETLPRDLALWCVSLVRKHLYAAYVAAPEFGWSDTKKYGEIVEPNGIILVGFAQDVQDARCDGSTTPGVTEDFARGPNMAGDDARETLGMGYVSCGSTDNSRDWFPIGFLSAHFALEDAILEDDIEIRLKHPEVVKGWNVLGDVEYEEDGGMYADEPGPKEDSYDDLDEEGDHVSSIYCYEVQIEEEFRKYGLGSHLMEELERIGRCNRLAKAILTVFRSNDKAVQFYRKIGYLPDGISPEHYATGIQAKRLTYYIMSKKLQ